MRNDWWAEAGCSKWLSNCGARFLSGVEKSLTYNRNKRQTPEAAVLPEKQIPVEVVERREKIQNLDTWGLGRHAEDAYNRAKRVRAKSIQEGRRRVLKRREVAKHRHESGVEANTLTSPIGKVSSDLSALTATAVRKVTVREHLVRVCEWQGIRPAASRLSNSGSLSRPTTRFNTTLTYKFTVLRLL